MIPTHTLISDWKDLLVRKNETLGELLKIMNHCGYQLALVVEDDSYLIGIVTDSDIRRALLKSIQLEDKVETVMNKSPFVVSENLCEEEARQLMILNNFLHLPVVNSQGILVGLHVAEHLQTISSREETLVIMAGGKGTRLLPLTKDTPKPMLPINGKPLLEHIIDNAKLEGITNFVISVNYLSDQIINYFGDGSDRNVKIIYVEEKEPLGTAGSLSHLPEHIKDQTVIVTNADLLTDASYLELLNYSINNGSDGVMAVRREEMSSSFGVVKSKGNKLLGINEKPTFNFYVNAGIYILGPKMLSLVEDGKYCDMPSLFELAVLNELDVLIYPIHESWIDVGRMNDYKLAGGDLFPDLKSG